MVVEGVGSAAIVFPLFNFILRGVKTAYDFASVPDETNDYLQTIKQVLGDLKIANKLRTEKAKGLDLETLTRVDGVIQNTEKAIAGLEALVEDARVGMSTDAGSVGAGPRMMWVIRDSNKAEAAMSRLGIASQSLHSEINMLRSQSSVTAVASTNPTVLTWSHSAGVYAHQGWNSPPPAYQQATMEAINERRLLSQRRASLHRKSSTAIVIRNHSPSQQEPLVPQNSSTFNSTNSASLSNLAEYIKHNEAMFSSLVPGAKSECNSLSPLAARDNTSELEAEVPTAHLQSSTRATSTAAPPTPTIRAPALPPSDPYASRILRQRLDGLSLSPIVSSRASQPQQEPVPTPVRTSRATRNRNRPRVQSQRPAIMESTTMLPGHRRARELRWEEPASGDEGEPYHAPPPAYRVSTPIPQDTISVVPSSIGRDTLRSPTVTDSEIDRRPTRRRPPKLHNVPLAVSQVEPMEPTAPQPESTGSGISHFARGASVRGGRNRLSRSEWQIQQQLEAMQRRDF